ncbi:MAG: hypothetical protein FD144_996 [Rhodospirillaceae bacterium]|nr:MAG: hypothetical protein FD144_996 [Rhodospirillaceae bacterium]
MSASKPSASTDRKLKAIVVADIVGYSLLTFTNEERTLSRVDALHRGVIEPSVAAHGGRIFKTTGDGFLMEFSSTIAAVRSSLAILRELAQQEIGTPPEEPFELRIGVHLGDAVVDGDDLRGNAVNIASRLQGCAEPGSLCVSGAVFDDIANKIEAVRYVEMEPQQLKNIPTEVRAYLVYALSGDDVRTAHTSTQSRAVAGELIAIGPDIVALAEVDGITDTIWGFRIKRFVLGDLQTLVGFLSDFKSVKPYDRYILSTALGDGRTLSEAPSLNLQNNHRMVACAIRPRVTRMPISTLRPEWAMSHNYDLQLDDNQRFVLISGAGALPQRITASLSLQRGESPRFPEVGSKLAEHFVSTDREYWNGLVSLEIIRLASIRLPESEPRGYETPLHCVERIRAVTILAREPTDGWLRSRVELDVNGFGRWSHELPFLTGRATSIRHVDADAVQEEATKKLGRLAVALARACPDGLGRTNYTKDDIQRLMPHLAATDIEDQVHAFQARGWVRLVKFAGGTWHLKLTTAFYEEVDPQVMGWTPAADARIVVLHMLNKETGRAAALHEACGWDRRRFNPAYRHVMQLVPSSSISPERSPTYPAVSILWQSEVKAALIGSG